MLKDRDVLEENLKTTINNYRHDKNVIKKVKSDLSRHGILEGEVQEIFAEMNLSELDLIVLCLFTMSLFEATKEGLVDSKQYFAPKDLKKAMQAQFKIEENKLQFPLVLERVLKLDDENYLTYMYISEIERWFDSNIPEYNFESQRSPMYKKSKDTIIEVPNISPKSVDEIAMKVLNKEYLPDTITFNALAGSSESGNEVEYDQKNLRLIINECEIDVLDGFHRDNGFLLAREKNPEIDLPIQVAIKNYDIETARKYFGQINTINKVDPVKIKSLKEERNSDYVVKQLMRKSELKGRVAESSRPSKLAGHIVSFGVLSDEINNQFEIPTRKDALELSEYLTEFFDYLLGTFQREFINEVEEIKRTSLINNNNMFIGYVVIAKRLKDLDKPISKLEDIIKGIDFKRDNIMWTEIGVLENNKVGRRTVGVRKAIREFFENLEIG